MTTARQLLALSALAGTLVAACDRGADTGTAADAPGGMAVTAADAPPMEPEVATSKEFGDYVLHFNALRTSDLSPEVAQSYNIVRSPNRVMLTLSMVRKADGSPGEPVAGTVEAQAVNLNGQFKNLSVREIREGGSIYYIGDVPIMEDETLVFTIDAVPAGSNERVAVRFSRDFQ